MGFRSTFVTNDFPWKWPLWFREKYADLVHFSPEGGAIASKHEGKSYGVFSSLENDIQRALIETTNDREWCLVFVYLHECGGITRCEIRRDTILWNEPDGWRTSDGIEHNYCYNCSAVLAGPR